MQLVGAVLKLESGVLAMSLREGTALDLCVNKSSHIDLRPEIVDK